MKLTKKFYNNHNISRNHFAALIGISPRTVSKFEKSVKSVNEDSRKKIETGMKVLEELELVFPDIKYIPVDPYEKDYYKAKKKSNSMDKKFATAFKKAMK